MGCMNTCTCPTSFHPVAPTLFMHLYTDFRAMIVPHLVGCCGEADGNGCMREISLPAVGGGPKSRRIVTCLDSSCELSHGQVPWM